MPMHMLICLRSSLIHIKKRIRAVQIPVQLDFCFFHVQADAIDAI